MDNPQGKNVPDAHYERHGHHAGELEMQEWQERLAQRPRTDLGVKAAVLLQEERSRRDMETG